MSGFPPYQTVSRRAAGRAGTWPKPPAGPAKVVIVGLVGAIAEAVIGLGIELYGAANAGSGRAAGGPVHPTLLVVTLLCTGIAFICWLYRARVNLYYFGVYDLRWKPGWTIGGWFLPIVNVVIPLLVVNEVDRASEARASAADGRARSSRDVFVMWAITWTGFLVLDRVTSVATPSVVDLSARDLSRYTSLSVLSAVLQIAAAVFAIRLVRRVTANQQRVLAAPRPGIPADPYAQAGQYAQGGPGAQHRPRTPAAPYAQAPFPAEPYQPPAQRYQPSAQPYQPSAQPYQPSAQPSAQPYQPAAEPYQPAAEPPAGQSPATVRTPAPAAPPAPASPPAPEPPDALRPPSDPWPSAGF
jgi:hypothetical protein